MFAVQNRLIRASFEFNLKQVPEAMMSETKLFK